MVRMCAPFIFGTAVQTAHQTWEQKLCFKLFDRKLDGRQILSKTIKNDLTATNKVAKR